MIIQRVQNDSQYYQSISGMKILARSLVIVAKPRQQTCVHELAAILISNCLCCYLAVLLILFKHDNEMEYQKVSKEAIHIKACFVDIIASIGCHVSFSKYDSASGCCDTMSMCQDFSGSGH